MPKENKVLALHKKFTRLPLGQKLFSMFCSWWAPYFRTIRPLITKIEPNHCEVLIKKRWGVQNHIGTVHVIAILNGLEMAMGFLAEASIPTHLRWIPKGMSVDYVAKANTNILCVATVDPNAWVAGDLTVNVIAYDTQQVPVVKGTITLWVSEKPKK